MNHSPFLGRANTRRHLREFFAEKFMREFFFCKRKIDYNVGNIDSFANYSIHGIQGIVKHEYRLVQIK